MKILLVEDEKKVARFIRQGLEAEGFHVDIVSDGAAGETLAQSGEYDLLILDVLLPKKDGFEVLQSVRTTLKDLPILMLTARSTTLDIVHGLDHGADDYLTKPFAFDELLARVRSLIRRGSRKVLRVSNLQLDTVSRKATRDGSDILLTSREFALLNLFMINTGKILTREQIGKEVWGFDFDPGTNIVDVYVNHLRNKIDENRTPKLLHTLRGKGYVLSEHKPTRG